jgi:hypothetical protein
MGGRSTDRNGRRRAPRPPNKSGIRNQGGGDFREAPALPNNHMSEIKGWVDSGLVGSTDVHSSHAQGLEPEHHAFSPGGVPQEQKMLKGHLHRVIYHQVCQYRREFHLETILIEQLSFEKFYFTERSLLVILE